MNKCSVTKNISICKGTMDDYRRLARFHYRDHLLGPYVAIYALKTKTISGMNETAGVIVYKMPATALELRNAATGGIFTGFDRVTQLNIINKNIRCISRVVIEPRFRGLGLASRLVSETMAEVKVPIVESLAVMGKVNPFFEKAGMKKYCASTPARCLQLKEAFSSVDIEEAELISPCVVHAKIESLPGDKKAFIEYQIRFFLQSYGRRRMMNHCQERTTYVLGQLTDRPVYYIWFNPNMKLIID